jgi:hypothetical protein
MYKIFVLVTMVLATGCASLRKSSHTTLVSKVDSSATVQATAVSEQTIISKIDTNIIIPADTIEYSLPDDFFSADTIGAADCVLAGNGSIDAVANKWYKNEDIKPKHQAKHRAKQQAKQFVINTPGAKAKFVNLGGGWKAQIVIPQKVVPIQQYNYTHTAIDSSKRTEVEVSVDEIKKVVVKEKKSGWQLYGLGIASALLLWILIRFIIKKYI